MDGKIQVDPEQVIGRLGQKIAQSEIDKAMLEAANESLRSQLAELENRIAALETTDA